MQAASVFFRVIWWQHNPRRGGEVEKAGNCNKKSASIMQHSSYKLLCHFSPSPYPLSWEIPANSQLLCFSETLKERKGSVLHSLPAVSDLFARGRRDFKRVFSPALGYLPFASLAQVAFAAGRKCHSSRWGFAYLQVNSPARLWEKAHTRTKCRTIPKWK